MSGCYEAEVVVTLDVHRPGRRPWASVRASQVVEDTIDRRGLDDEGDDAHLLAAAGTGERVHLEEASQQFGPAALRGGSALVT